MKLQHFAIITPSYNSLPWLKNCLKSVMDQSRDTLHIHHHIQDGQSSDGSKQYLQTWAQQHKKRKNYSFSFQSKADKGMYHAINRGLRQIPENSHYIAHLNSDEQYLPGALEKIIAQFMKNPKADILLGGYIILDAQQQYICHRRPVQPKLWSSWLNCACITNSCFIRGEKKKDIHYNERWKCIGDMELFRTLLEKKLQFRIIPEITSSFVCTGGNLAWSEESQREWESLRREAPLYAAWGWGAIYRWVNIQRRIRDFFMKAPMEYKIYYADEEERRQVRIGAGRATCRWNGRTVANEA